jgi:hypothetical protein
MPPVRHIAAPKAHHLTPKRTNMRGTASPDCLSGHLVALAIWSARTPINPCGYTPAELERQLGRSMRALAQPLLLSRWQRVVIFSRKSGKPTSRALWVPPGCPTPVPTRGRPRFNLYKLTGA